MQRLKKNKLFIFIVILIIIGFTCGIIYYLFIDKQIKMDISATLQSLDVLRYNAIFKDLIIMSLLLVSAFLLVGIPLSIFYILYESFTLGFLSLAFFNVFKIKGLFYIIFYLLINKLVTFILMLFFIKKIITITRLSIGFIIYKKDNNIKEKIINNFINSLYIIIFVLIINIILFFISPLFFSLLK